MALKAIARRLLVIAGLLAGGLKTTANAAAATANAPMAAPISFNRHVQPILADNCYPCHGPDGSNRKARLQLDLRESALQGGKSGLPAIVPGKPDESELFQRITSKDPDELMPPPEAHKTLAPRQVETLRRWIAGGANYEGHWAFVAPSRTPLPKVRPEHARWVRSPIDRFVLARLEEEGLEPSPEADRAALIRRVTLDLTGIVPQVDEVAAFVADTSPDAFDKVVDRLLASPRYGEHRARYWLDYARYADTHGLHFDNYRAIWPYRDYVIRAFNANKPFDRFVREQLAGDLLPARTFDELTATGFVRCNLTTNEGGTIPEEVFVNQTRDRVEAFGATFLGLTTGCAACHDHKFDPITQRDFYGLAAFLNNTAEKAWDMNIEDPAPVVRLPAEELRASAEFLLNARGELQARLEARRRQTGDLFRAWLNAGNRPKGVAPEQLELRLRLDEGGGPRLRNSAPMAQQNEFKAETNPPVWGESSWLWPSMRLDIFTRIFLGNMADVEANERFSAGGWVMLRARPGGGVNVQVGTGDGVLLSRMGDAGRRGGAGWELGQEATQFVVTLAADGAEGTPAKPESTGNAAAKTAEEAFLPESAIAARPSAARVPVRGLQVLTRSKFPVGEWVHVFFTYDGSRQAPGIKIYVNGKPAETQVRRNALGANDSIRTDAAMFLGRRDDGQNMVRETRFQDVRFYRRALAADEVARLPFEDVACEIMARQQEPEKWTTDERFVVLEKFFLGEKDQPAMNLVETVRAHDAAFEALTRNGRPTLIARERTTPAYADVLKRGNYDARAERVEPSVPHFLPSLPPDAPRNRRGLAEWLLRADQPLFSRVVVNRMWQEVFGRGLVETAGDFGVMGERPSHPELLDWLAVEFRESGWDVKRFYRLLLTSAVYRQTARFSPTLLARDPANRLLARGPRFRMDGEMLRDSALAVSGLLVEKIGGPPAKPYQPPGLWEEVAMPESNTKSYEPDKGDGLYRRSVYTFWKRSAPPPSMEIFDATSRETVCSRRARSDTPLQAFVTLNDPQWIEAARKLAEWVVRTVPSAGGRIDSLARATVARPLDSAETEVLRGALQALQAKFAGRPEQARALLAVGESSVDATLPVVELATWTMMANQFFNLDEFLTK